MKSRGRSRNRDDARVSVGSLDNGCSPDRARDYRIVPHRRVYRWFHDFCFDMALGHFRMAIQGCSTGYWTFDSLVGSLL